MSDKKDIGKVLSLSRARKSRARAAKKREADANAVLHGRNKLVRLADAAEAARVKAVLDAHERYRDALDPGLDADTPDGD